MKNKIKVVRYSDTGFAPVHQTKMQEAYDYQVDFTPSQLESELPSDISRYAKKLILEETLITKSELDHNFSFSGIHIFIGEPSETTRKFQLNHLPKGSALPEKHIAYLNPDTPVRTLMVPYMTVSTEIALSQAQENHWEGAFIEGHNLIMYNPALFENSAQADKRQHSKFRNTL